MSLTRSLTGHSTKVKMPVGALTSHRTSGAAEEGRSNAFRKAARCRLTAFSSAPRPALVISGRKKKASTMNKQRDAPLYITYGSAFLITGLSLSCILFAFSQYATKVEEAKAKLVEMNGGESGEVSSVKVENSI